VTSPAANAAFPTVRLLAVIAGTGAALLVLWTVVKVGGIVDEEVYKGVVLGLCAATGSHILGTFFGAYLAAAPADAGRPGRPIMTAYLGSTTVRFLATPALAVSLYFLLPQKPAALLLGAAAGHLLIMVADVAALLRFVQGSARPSAPNA
jgi:hypothetical protein